MTLNLAQQRSGSSVWDRGSAAWHPTRWLIATIGSALVMAGLRRSSLQGLLLTVGGASLGWWATTASRGQRAPADIRQVWPRRRDTADAAGQDRVIEASEESFPASDPPAWTSMSGNS